MSNSPLVSVLLPVYNGSDFVEQAIRSIQSQTYINWELLVCDDGSQDTSLDICKRAAQKDNRIQVFSNTFNIGLAATMNRLLNNASGKYIAVQEQDDVSQSRRFEKEVSLLDLKPDIGLVSGLAEWLDDRGQFFARFPGILNRGEQYPQDQMEMVKFLYVEQCKVVNAGCMFRHSVLDSISKPVFDEAARMSIDWQFFIHVAHYWKIWGLNETVVYMKRGSHRHLSSNKELQFYEARRCIQKIYDQYDVDVISPVNYILYRRAMSTQLTLEGRNTSRVRGILILMKAILYFPVNWNAWNSIFEIVWRGTKKMFVQRNVV